MRYDIMRINGVSSDFTTILSLVPTAKNGYENCQRSGRFIGALSYRIDHTIGSFLYAFAGANLYTRLSCCNAASANRRCQTLPSTWANQLFYPVRNFILRSARPYRALKCWFLGYFRWRRLLAPRKPAIHYTGGYRD